MYTGKHKAHFIWCQFSSFKFTSLLLTVVVGFRCDRLSIHSKWGTVGQTPGGLISAYSGSFRSNITKADSVLFAGEDTSFPANSTLILSHCFKLAFWNSRCRKCAYLGTCSQIMLYSVLEISATGLENLTAIFQPPRTE